MAGAKLIIEGLTKRFGDVEAVGGVDITIAPGEFVTLLGPSGSGKTTVLNMIAGFLEPTSGRIRVDGADITSLPPYRRNIGMVFQSYTLFPHMTVERNVGFPLRQRKVPKLEVREKVQRALDLVQLGSYLDRYPRQLSGGQQQRVAIARAIVYEPKLLLMDEPFGALDKKLREAMQLEMKRIHSELGITFVFVTHDQEEALILSDRIAVFNEGRIQQIGTAEDLYDRPETLFVADFIGESNKVPGRVGHNGAVSWVEGASFRAFASANPSVAAGSAGVVVVRPERAKLIDPREPLAVDANGLDGTIDSVIYLGSMRRVVVNLDCGLPATVTLAPGQDIPNADGRVRVGWDVEHALLLPDPGRI